MTNVEPSWKALIEDLGKYGISAVSEMRLISKQLIVIYMYFRMN
jgi:hypothetical protein